MDNNKMFCFQCQETAGCKGCTISGVCGKKPLTAKLQDMLIFVTKGLSEVTTYLRNKKITVPTYINRLVNENLFITITNANFDDEVIKNRVYETIEESQKFIKENNITENFVSANFVCSNDTELMEKAEKIGVLSTENEDVRSLREMIVYGLKGMAAYLKHANALNKDSEEINAFLQSTLAKTLDNSLSVDDLVALTLETGKFGVDVMALLDSANTEAYGNPEITKVNIGVRNNPAILVSGHDLKTLKCFLNRQKAQELMFIHTLKCFLLTIIQHLRNIAILQVTMVMLGGNRKRNLNHSMVQYFLQQTVLCHLLQAIKIEFIQLVQ